MKLKMIMAAIGLTLSAASQAAAIVTPATIGGSDLLLNVWESGAPGGQPDQSFTFDLGITFTNFVNAGNTSATLATLLSSDATWNSFLTSSDTTDVGALQWSVIASGNKVPTARPAIFGTATVGTDPSSLGITAAALGQANTQVATFVNNLNANVSAPNLGEQVGAKGSGLYSEDLQLSSFNLKGFSNGNNIGATAAVWTGSNVAGQTAAVMASLPGTITFAQVGGSYVLSYNVAAVPEAPGFGMALAGLAALGFLAIRRKNA